MELNDWLFALISGGIVAAAQLLIVYLWIERYVEKIQLKAEQKKWEASRRELCASLLFFAHVICRPSAHYSKLEESKLHPRKNIVMMFDHIQDKSRDFNALLAAYAGSIPPEWHSEIVAANFDLQTAANNARVASKNWAQFETMIDKGEPLTAMDFDGKTIQSMVDSTQYKIPSTFPDRQVAIFTYSHYYTLLSITHATDRLISIIDMILSNKSISELNHTAIFSRLHEISKEHNLPLTAEYFRSQVRNGLQKIKDHVQAMRMVGFSLQPSPEFD